MRLQHRARRSETTRRYDLIEPPRGVQPEPSADLYALTEITANELTQA